MKIESEILNLFKSNAPDVSSIVSMSLPIPFFGRYAGAVAATVSLNPSDKEFLDRNGFWLKDSSKRFESFHSLNCLNNTLLTDAMVIEAYKCCLEYFERPTAYWSWFNHTDKLISNATEGKLTYRNGQLAHFDLSPWATNPVWSGLSESDQSKLKINGVPFLKWIIFTSSAKLFFLNGRTTSETVMQELSNRVINWLPLEGDKRCKYFTAKESIQGKEVVFIGWNLYLQQGARTTSLVQLISNVVRNA